MRQGYFHPGHRLSPSPPILLRWHHSHRLPDPPSNSQTLTPVPNISWQIDGEKDAAQLAIIRQMSGQVSRGSAGEYQADERAGVAGLRSRVFNFSLLQHFPPFSFI